MAKERDIAFDTTINPKTYLDGQNSQKWNQLVPLSNKYEKTNSEQNNNTLIFFTSILFLSTNIIQEWHENANNILRFPRETNEWKKRNIFLYQIWLDFDSFHAFISFLPIKVFSLSKTGSILFFLDRNGRYPFCNILLNCDIICNISECNFCLRRIKSHHLIFVGFRGSVTERIAAFIPILCEKSLSNICLFPGYDLLSA